MATIPSINVDLALAFPTVVGFAKRQDRFNDHDIAMALLSEWRENINELDYSQTPNGMHKLPAMNELNIFVKTSVISYLRQHNYIFQDDDLYVAACWGNFSKGHWMTHGTRVHHHSNSLVSVVYYIDAPAGSGNLVLYPPNPAVDMLLPEMGNFNQFNAQTFDIVPEQGKCVIFKSSIRHSIDPNRFEQGQCRISISYTFNLKSIGPAQFYGNYEMLSKDAE